MENTNNPQRIQVGTSITISHCSICTRDMGGYPVDIYRFLTVCQDGYRLTGREMDAGGRAISKEEIFIEKGFFAKSSLKRIVSKLSSVAFGNYDVGDLLRNAMLVELMEYDRRLTENEISDSPDAIVKHSKELPDRQEIPYEVKKDKELMQDNRPEKTTLPKEKASPMRFEKAQIADGMLATSHRISFTDSLGAERSVTSCYNKFSGSNSCLLFSSHSEGETETALQAILEFMYDRYGVKLCPIYFGDVDPMYADPEEMSKCWFTLNSIDFVLIIDWEVCSITLIRERGGAGSTFPDKLAVELARCMSK